MESFIASITSLDFSEGKRKQNAHTYRGNQTLLRGLKKTILSQNKYVLFAEVFRATGMAGIK